MKPKLFDLEALREGYQALRRNRRRSIATAFGIFWGIFMLIILLSLSRGLERGLNKMTASIAPNTLQVYSNPTSLNYNGFPRGRDWELEQRDVDLLRQRLSKSSEISGCITVWSTQIRYGTKSTQRPLVGGDEVYFRTALYDLIAGRTLTSADHKLRSKVCLLGYRAAEILFGSDYKSGIGSYITVSGYSFRVVGIIKARSNNISLGASTDWSILTSVEAVRVVTNNPLALSFLFVSLPNKEIRDRIKDDIRQLILPQHQISPKDIDALGIFDTGEIFAVFSNIQFGLSILVWIIAIGTLLTAVIGVSNILIVTVRERTQEIGIRRALGAKPSDIIRQIMLESLMLTSVSGLVGLVLGVGVMSLLSLLVAQMKSADVPFGDPTISLTMALFAIVIIIIAGILAGLLPASQAIRIKAIEAIREE